MKGLFIAASLLMCSAVLHANNQELSADEIAKKVAAITQAQNTMMLAGSSKEDIDALFALYSEDFVYVHEVYGGTYSREQLYHNSLNNQQAGRYTLTEPRYQILHVLPGLNAAAVQRRELKSGKVHLTLFEFKGEKVSKVIEYWR